MMNMKIALEQLDDENFLDIVLTVDELERILDDKLVTGVATIFSERVYVGIGLNTDTEDEDSNDKCVYDE